MLRLLRLQHAPKNLRLGLGLSGSVDVARDQSAVKHLLKLKDAFFPNFALLFAWVLILNREGAFVPSNNESLYLLQLAKLWNSNFLLNDWTFAGPLTSHFIFNFLVGPFTLLFSMEVVGWIGRIVSWSITLVALFKLGQHFRIPLWMITLSILLWLLYDQSIVGGEWILGSFEAKSIAYPLLFFSLNGFMHRREVWPAILLGLVFSFHPLVGLWSILAVGLSFVPLGYPVTAIIKSGLYTGLFALPGLIPLLMTFDGGTQEAWRFMAIVVIPYHFDPFYFANSKLLVFQLFFLLGFNIIHIALSDKNYALRFLISLQLFLACFFILGFLARWADYYDILKFMPGRLFPVLVPLFFFFHLMSTLRDSHRVNHRAAVIVLGLFAFASFGSPFEVLVQKGRHHYAMWTRGEDDVQTAFRWIAINTPSDSVVISPPWRGDSFYFSKRAQIASWWVPRLDRLAEWRERLELIAGDVSSVKPETTKARMDYMIAHYNRLREADIESLTEKYGANYLVSASTYSYPILFNSGTYKVYLIRREGVDRTKT
jgi:hypothetical protein